MHHGPTLAPPASHLRAQSPDAVGGRVSPIAGINHQITPSASGGHAQPSTQSRAAARRALFRASALVSCPVLN